MANLPAGRVTVLFTDVEGPTRLLQQRGERWKISRPPPLHQAPAALLRRSA